MQRSMDKISYQAYLLTCMFRDVDEMIDFGILSPKDYAEKFVERNVLPWYHKAKRYQGGIQHETK